MPTLAGATLARRERRKAPSSRPSSSMPSSMGTSRPPILVLPVPGPRDRRRHRALAPPSGPRDNGAMNVLIVTAHPEPRSLNGALTAFAAAELRRAGHDVHVSDLYAMGWRSDVGP